MNPILSGYKCILAILGGKKSANFLTYFRLYRWTNRT